MPACSASDRPAVIDPFAAVDASATPQADGAAPVDGAAPGDGGGPQTSAEHFATDLCALLEGCCPGSSAGCKKEFTTAFFNPASAEICLAQAKANQRRSPALFCSGDAGTEGRTGAFFPLSEACVAAVVGPGTAQAGEACRRAKDCAPPAQGAPGCLLGSNGEVCAPLVHAKLGERCGGTMGTSVITGEARVGEMLCWESDGLRCSPVQEDAGVFTNRCVPVTALGATCTVPDECGSDAVCDRIRSTTCFARAGLGGTCPTTIGIAGCTQGMYCKGGVCAPLGLPGATCDGANPCIYGACTGGTCPPMKGGTVLPAWFCKK